MEEERLIVRALEDEVEDARFKWEEALGQVGYVRRTLKERGIPPHPQTLEGITDPGQGYRGMFSVAFDRVFDAETSRRSPQPQPRNTSSSPAPTSPPHSSPNLPVAHPASFPLGDESEETDAVQHQNVHVSENQEDLPPASAPHL